MEIVRFEGAGELRGAAEPFLMRNEAEHNMILGLIGRLEREPYDPEHDPDFYASTPFFAAAVTDGEVVGAGIMTPPFPLVVSRWEGDREGLRLLARDLRAFDPEATGVNASVPVAASFAEAWSEITGEATDLRLSERIYRLDASEGPAESRVRPAPSRRRTQSW